MMTNRTFGVEFEMVSKLDKREIARKLNNLFTTLGNGHQVHVDNYSHQTDNLNFTNWIIKPDSSIEITSAQYRRGFDEGVELVTPVMKSIESIELIEKVLDALDGKVDVNRSCGLHVHQGVTREEQYSRKLCNMIYHHYYCEKWLYSILPLSRQSNDYAVKYRRQFTRNEISRLRTNDDWQDWYQNTNFHNNSPSYRWRYLSMNLESVKLRNTLEFRLHSGTTEFDKVKNFVLFTQNYVERGLVDDIAHDEMNFENFIEQFKGADMNASNEIPINPLAKRKRIPKESTKVGLIFKLVCQGQFSKNDIVNELVAKFGRSTGKYSYSQIVEHKISDFRSINYGFGLTIKKSAGKYYIDGLGNRVAGDSEMNSVVDYMLERKNHFNHDDRVLVGR